MSCPICNNRPANTPGACHVCLFLWSSEEIKTHKSIIDTALNNIPASTVLGTEELADFVVRCLPYTDTYKIQYREEISKVAKHIVEQYIPVNVEVLDGKPEESDAKQSV